MKFYEKRIKDSNRRMDADGTNDIMDISAITGIKVSEVINLIDDLSRNHLIKSN